MAVTCPTVTPAILTESDGWRPVASESWAS